MLAAIVVQADDVGEVLIALAIGVPVAALLGVRLLPPAAAPVLQPLPAAGPCAAAGLVDDQWGRGGGGGAG